MDRVDFYYKQLVTQAEMDQAFQMVAEAIGDRAKDSNAGIAYGLEAFEAATPDLTIDISPGRAYTLDTGDRIVMASVQNVGLSYFLPTTPGNSVWCRVLIKHAVQTSDSRTDGLGNPLDYVTEDYFQLVVRAGTEAVSPTRPSWNSDEVAICSVLLTYGQTQIFQSDIYENYWGDYDRFQGFGPKWHKLMDFALRFDGAKFDAGEFMMDFDGGEVEGLSNVEMTGAGATLKDVDEITLVNNGSFLNTKRGHVLMDDLAGGVGGNIYCETGEIYKADRVRVAEPGAANGYQYVEAGGGGSETGIATNPEKWFQIPFACIHTGMNNFQHPWQGGSTPTLCWYLSNYIQTTGQPPSTAEIPGWKVLLNTGVAGTYWTFPLYIDLSTIHSPVHITRFEIDLRVLTAMGAAQTFQAYLVEISGSNWNGIKSATDGSEDVSYGSTGDQTYGQDVNFVNDSENYHYMLIVTLKTTQIVNNTFLIVYGARIKYEIREASHYY